MEQTPASPEPRLDPESARVDQLAHEVLRDAYRTFTLERLELVEEPTSVHVKVRLRRSPENDVVDVEGHGVGLVDAFFEGVLRAWAAEFPSLKTIALEDFLVSTGFDGARGRRSDALAVATLKMKNAHGVTCSFERGTTSVTRSCLLVSLDALTFFINAERAYVQLQLALKDATERRRSDLVTRYRQQMSTLVAATSYAELSDKHRAPAG
jgi:hypothetical protein